MLECLIRKLRCKLVSFAAAAEASDDLPVHAWLGIFLFQSFQHGRLHIKSLIISRLGSRLEVSASEAVAPPASMQAQTIPGPPQMTSARAHVSLRHCRGHGTLQGANQNFQVSQIFGRSSGFLLQLWARRSDICRPEPHASSDARQQTLTAWAVGAHAHWRKPDLLASRPFH